MGGSAQRRPLVASFCLVVFCLVLCPGCASHQGTLGRGPAAVQAKYVFLFIGDGMGPAQRHAAEMYLAGSRGADRPECPQLLMDSFPVTGTATTYPANALITDSAAAGTALASGLKTANGVLNISEDGAFRFRTVAEAARERGMRVGIVSTVSIDHATPAAFYAHQKSRNDYWEISMQLAASGFDYFAGGYVAGDHQRYRADRESPMDAAKRNGFRVATNQEELLALSPDGRKTIAYPGDARGPTSVRYEIDRSEGDVTLADFTRKGIELLDNPDGFFLMVEGGKIDGACHVHDAVSAVLDVIALDGAVAEAYAFLRKHPDETLIVVTADHETGGLTFLSGRSCRTLYERMRLQTVSQGRFVWELSDAGEPLPDFAGTMAVVKRCFGLMAADDPEVEALKQMAEAGDEDAKARLGGVLRPSELDALKRAWEMSFLDADARKADPEISALYASYTPIGVECTQIVGRKAGMQWVTFGHTGTPVPVTAVGVGQGMFAGFCDNTDVARGLMAAIGARPLRIEAMQEALSQ